MQLKSFFSDFHWNLDSACIASRYVSLVCITEYLLMENSDHEFSLLQPKHHFVFLKVQIV